MNRNMKRNRGLFEGAGIVVREPRVPKNDGSYIIVETEYAREVSKLIFSLKDVFEGGIDYISKYEFYGRLAEAAVAQLEYGDNLDSLRKAIIDEACVIATEMDEHLYFAYGSNMDAKQMSHRCPEAIYAGTASLHDYRFELDSAGVATVIESPGSVVHGALWLVSRLDEENLDCYEGVGVGCYRKEALPIANDAEDKLTALVYVSNRDVHDGITYRSGYMDNIIRNAKRLGFDAEYIELLEAK